MGTNEVAVIVGAGPGLGNALVRRCAEAGMRVAAVSRKGLAGAESLLQPAAIAETYYQLHRQSRSAWTHELDLRPSSEKF